MRWLDILEGIETSVSAEIKASGTFDPSKLRLIGAKIQKDLAVQSRCLDDGYYAFTTVATQQEYLAPVDYLLPMDVRIGTVPQGGLSRRPLYPVDLSGQSTGFYRRGRYFGLNPIPSSALASVLYYYRKPPLYAMQVWFNDDVHTSIDTVAMDVGVSGIIISTVNLSATAVDFNFTYASADTIVEMVALINTKNTNGIYAKMYSECVGTELCTSLETREDIDIKTGGVTVPPNRDVIGEQKPRLFFEPEIPDEAQDIIELGVVYKLKYQDRELPAGQLEQSEYYQKRMQFIRQYQARQKNALGFSTVRKIPMSGSRSGAGMRIFIP